MNSYNSQREYERRDGNAKYLDGSCLERPFSMPYTSRIVVIVVLIVAIVCGIAMVYWVYDTAVNGHTADQQLIDANISRQVSTDVPQLQQMVGADDSEIMESINSAGFITFDIRSTTDAGKSGFDIFCAPADMTLEDASELYSKGISSLDSVDAAKLLKGSWKLSVSHESSDDFVLRLADFSSGSIQQAVNNAASVQGFDQGTITDSGIDESGNTYLTGTIDVVRQETYTDYDWSIEEYVDVTDTIVTTCTWKISSCKLTDFYSLDGIPDTAAYVVVKLVAPQS